MEPYINTGVIPSVLYKSRDLPTAMREMNLKLACLLLTICIAIIIIIVWAFQTGGKKFMVCESLPQDLDLEEKNWDMRSLIFDDLSPTEMMQVNRYLQQDLGVPLVEPSQAKPADNCIYSITLQLPPKVEVLKFLDHQGRRPTRRALVTLYFGNQDDPNITELLVGPLPHPRYHYDVTVKKYGSKLPYSRRPLLRNEFRAMHTLLKKKEYPKAPNFMHKVFDYNGSTFQYSHEFPPGFQSGDRLIWVNHFQSVSAFYLHPLGFEIQLDISSLDVSDWKVKKVFYNGQYFEDMEDIERQFNEGYVNVVKVKKSPPDGGYSSLQQRVPPTGPGPLHYEPRGPRYSIRNNQVNFLPWSFAFGTDAFQGPRVFDIRFKGERIVYELSLQDAMTVYGSNSPGLMQNRIMDAVYGLGRDLFTLTPGVDCPYLATYLDRHYFVDTSLPVTHKNAICIFEQNAGVPIRRHYNSAGTSFYGGLVDSAVVFRSISTVGNYDYVWDFIFHQNGAVGVRVHASGYIQTSFFFDDAAEFGNRIQEWVLGAIHTHSIQFKVDMDIGGVENTLMSNDMAFETVKAPWSPKHKINRMKMVRNVLDTENEAAFRLHDDMPRHIYFAANSTNKWGHKRGYRIQMVSFSGDHMPETDPMERAISWERYKLAVTKRKEKEPTSTSPYNMLDPWSPTVAFADFINNESIVNEDLVAWITTGFLHIPHAEDIPNTVTLGNVLGFFLRPYNYFDEDPSIYSPDSVFFTSEQDFTSCDVNQLACLQKTAACVPNFPTFTYSGFQNMTKL